MWKAMTKLMKIVSNLMKIVNMYLEFSVSNVKLTEIGEASSQLPGEVCRM